MRCRARLGPCPVRQEMGSKPQRHIPSSGPLCGDGSGARPGRPYFPSFCRQLGGWILSSRQPACRSFLVLLSVHRQTSGSRALLVDELIVRRSPLSLLTVRAIFGPRTLHSFININNNRPVRPTIITPRNLVTLRSWHPVHCSINQSIFQSFVDYRPSLLSQ